MIDPRQRNIALLVAGCFFMEMLDGTIVATAAPRLGASLGVGASEVGLVITAYLLTLAVLIPLGGWLTAQYGARRVFLAAIATFTVASSLCALSRDLGELVAMRVLQGAGGALMVPVGRMLVLSRTDKPDIPRAVSFITWPGLVAPIIAPLLGGVITTYLGWHWLFLINIPLGVVAFVVARRLVHAEETPPPARLDWPGVFLTCSGLGLLTYTAHLLAGTAHHWPLIATGTVASALALALAVRHLLRAPAPLINLRVLAVATYRRAIIDTSFYWIPVGAVPFLLPLLFEEHLGWSAIKSGAVVLFVFAGNLGIKPATTFVINRFGFRLLLLTSTSCLAATMVAFAFINAATPLALIALNAFVSGVARSLAFTGYNTIAYADVPPGQMRDANTLQSTTVQTAQGLGIAAAAVALRIGATLDAPAAYPIAFALLALVAAAPVVGALRVHPGAGDVLRTPRRPANRNEGARS